MPRRSWTVRVNESSPEGIILAAMVAQFGTFRNAVRHLIKERLEREAARYATPSRGREGAAPAPPTEPGRLG